MDLKARIAGIPPREKSGSISSSRFDYQKDWSLSKLMEIHSSGDEYLVVFDWHDDFLIMNSEDSPTELSFFQIKGKKSGNWTINNLLKAKTAKDGSPLLSIIAKLYDCKSKFDLETKALNFISNARFNVKLLSGIQSESIDTICLTDLEANEKKKVLEAIKLQHGSPPSPLITDITFLKVATLSLDDSATHVKGQITDFLESLSPGNKTNVNSVYRMLFDEVKRRTNYSGTVTSFEDLAKHKAISRTQFKAIIEATGITYDYRELWRRVEVSLQGSNVPFRNQRSLAAKLTELELVKMQPDNKLLFVVTDYIKHLVHKFENEVSNASLSLIDSINHIFGSINQSQIPSTYDEYFIKAIIIFELYEYK